MKMRFLKMKSYLDLKSVEAKRERASRMKMATERENESAPATH